LGRTERIAVAFLAIGLITIGGAFLVTRALVKQSSSDQDNIRALARRSIEVLPQGQWPSLYNDFTADFQARCTLADFTQAGVDSATNLGASLHLLEFSDLKDLAINGTTATATIVGDLSGQANSAYDVDAAFAKENGAWKLAAASGTTGCQAFNVVSPQTSPTPIGLPPTT
jgi:hypothetical protein